MNYYIQGDAAKADQIKAAFEAKAIYSNLTFANENYLYYSCDGKVDFCFIGGGLANIIKTHPDYKELKLHVEPKVKVGDWLYHNTYGARPILVKGYSKRKGYKVECIRTTYYLQKDVIENEYHFWTIADAKDGDVLVTTKIRNCPFIYRKTSRNNGLAYYYAGVDGNGDFCEGCLKRTLYHFGSVADITPATKEQRDLLFAKIKEAGYQWDADKKELRKIQPHYDIKNFHVGMPVLVRADNNCRWDYSVFSRITGNESWQFAVCNGVSFTQCIPFDDNKELLGTTNMPDKEYINW